MPESVDPEKHDAGPKDTGQTGDRAQDVSSSSIGDEQGYPWVPHQAQENTPGQLITLSGLGTTLLTADKGHP